MRRGLRYQLLVPPAVLLLGVAGTTTWTATASAARAREQLVNVLRTNFQQKKFDDGLDAAVAYVRQRLGAGPGK